MPFRITDPSLVDMMKTVALGVVHRLFGLCSPSLPTYKYVLLISVCNKEPWRCYSYLYSMNVSYLFRQYCGYICYKNVVIKAKHLWE